jgi:hypothetical protein
VKAGNCEGATGFDLASNMGFIKLAAGFERDHRLFRGSFIGVFEGGLK